MQELPWPMLNSRRVVAMKPFMPVGMPAGTGMADHAAEASEGHVSHTPEPTCGSGRNRSV